MSSFGPASFACKIRLLGQGDWMVPLEIQSLHGVLWISDKSFLSLSCKTVIPNITYFVTGHHQCLKNYEMSLCFPTVQFSWELKSVPMWTPQVQEVFIPHTHLRWNTSCIGTALFLTVLFQDVSDLYLLPQQLCPWTLVWWEAGRGKCDVTALLQPL